MHGPIKFVAAAATLTIAIPAWAADPLPTGAYVLSPSQFAEFCKQNPGEKACVNQRLMDIIQGNTASTPSPPPASTAKPTPSTSDLWREFDQRDKTAPGRPLTPEEQKSLDGAITSLKAMCAEQPQLPACKER